MDRLKDEEIGEMWSKNYPRRYEKSSRLLLTAPVNSIEEILIIASKDGGNYPKSLEVSLQQCSVPAHEFSEIE